MAIKKPLVNYGGQIGELLSSDSLSGTAINSFSEIVSLDFGTDGELAKTTVLSLILTNANLKNFQFIWQTSSDHISYEEYLIEGINLSITNIIDNTSFDVIAMALNRTRGIYNFKTLILWQ
jgi:hypothetical protein